MLNQYSPVNQAFVVFGFTTIFNNHQISLHEKIKINQEKIIYELSFHQIVINL